MKTWSLHALTFVSALVFSFSVLQAQNTSLKSAPETQQVQQPTLKPQMTLSDVAFTLNTLATVNITGNEVEAYIDVKNTFAKAFEQAQHDKKGENDMLTIEMSVLTANNFLQLFQRVNLQGAAAEKYMSVKNALYASAPKQPTLNPSDTGLKK